MATLPISQRNMTMVAFQWVPWGFYQDRNGRPYGWFPLGGNRYLSWGLGADRDERIAWAWGSLVITRPETPEEYEERREEEAILHWEERDLNRYTEWYY